MILLGSQRQLSKIHSDSLDSVLLNGVPIPFADSVKNLGVSMDKLLSGDLWVKQTCQKAFALIHRFYSVVDYGSQPTLDVHLSLIHI